MTWGIKRINGKLIKRKGLNVGFPPKAMALPSVHEKNFSLANTPLVELNVITRYGDPVMSCCFEESALMAL
jgi:hypothetical protein